MRRQGIRTGETSAARIESIILMTRLLTSLNCPFRGISFRVEETIKLNYALVTSLRRDTIVTEERCAIFIATINTRIKVAAILYRIGSRSNLHCVYKIYLESFLIRLLSIHEEDLLPKHAQ